jgi:multicomponent K+:H+ antiporter subunit F
MTGAVAIDLAIDLAFACFGLGLLMNLWLLLAGPDVVDRILALDTMVINVVALIVLWGLRAESPLYFEAAMLFTMTGFIGTVAYCKFLLRGDIIE